MPQLTDIGRIGRDAEIRYTSGRNPGAIIKLAVACDYGPPSQGKRAVQWVEAVFQGEKAETLAPALLKGRLIHFTLIDVHIEEYQRTDKGYGSKLTGRVLAIRFIDAPCPPA